MRRRSVNFSANTLACLPANTGTTSNRLFDQFCRLLALFATYTKPHLCSTKTQNKFMKTNILIAGATGNLGHLIATELVKNEAVSVSALVRDANAPKAAQLQAMGVRLIEGELTDKAALLRATEGQQTVISALSGGPDLIVAGQLSLLEAALQQGVTQFVPSDYSVDYFRLQPGDNVNLDLRRQVADAVMQSGIGYTIFLNGAFTEVFAGPFFGVIDQQAATLTYWGTGDERFDLTTIPDTARFIADAVLDPATLNKIVPVAGDEISINEIAAVLETTTGQTFTRNVQGTDADLLALIEGIRAQDPTNVYAYVFFQYKRPMFNGVGKLTAPARKHYDGTPLTTLRNFLTNPDQQYRYQPSL
jgi:uncharacterized protein YbjT (DUF2867 family)